MDTLQSKCMLGGSYVRPHLVRKHMLCFAADREAAGQPVDFSKMTMGQLKRLSPDMSEFLKEVPTQLPPHKLSAQLHCPAEYVSMWACLWKQALAEPGAFQFVMANAEMLSESVYSYKDMHGISPSPRVLLRFARGASSLGGCPGPDDDDDEGWEDEGSEEQED